MFKSVIRFVSFKNCDVYQHSHKKHGQHFWSLYQICIIQRLWYLSTLSQKTRAAFLKFVSNLHHSKTMISINTLTKNPGSISEVCIKFASFKDYDIYQHSHKKYGQHFWSYNSQYKETLDYRGIIVDTSDL